MLTSDLISVSLTKEQAALFILFQGQYDNIGFLFKENVFDLRGGNAVLSFDEQGTLRTIKKEIYCRRLLTT